jgi:hypothetical protein
VRRIIITKEIISFSFVDADTEIDFIPLDEVDFVKEMKDDVDVNLLNVDHGDQDGSDTALHAIQIATDREGHNSGRDYYIQVSSKDSYDRLSAYLRKSAKAAKKRAEAHTAFRRSQWRVRKVYESKPCQVFVALMISAVNSQTTFWCALPSLFDPAVLAELRVHHPRVAAGQH